MLGRLGRYDSGRRCGGGVVGVFQNTWFCLSDVVIQGKVLFFFFFTNPWASLAYPHWDVPRSWLVDRIVHSRSFCSNNVSPEFSNFSCLSAEIPQATAAVSLQLSARSGVGMMEENEVSDPYG